MKICWHAATGPQIRRNANLDRDLALGEDFHQLGIFDCRQPMTDALCPDVKRRPDALRPDRLSGMSGQPQASVTGLGIKLAERLGSGPPLVAADADTNDRRKLIPKLRSLAENPCGFFGSKVAH